MRKLPKWPKGLKRTLARLERKAAHDKKIKDRLKEIDDAKKAVANLRAGKPKRAK